MTGLFDRLRDRAARLMPGETPEPPRRQREMAVPIVWMLGKTGAGKSSLIRALTGLEDIDIGTGFAACTRTSQSFDHPAGRPVVRFLDTRGLGEAAYDPAADLEYCAGHSHAILIVARLDDPVQGEVAEAAAAALRHGDMPALIVHTGADLLPDDSARDRARRANERLFQKTIGRALPAVEMALPPGDPGARTGMDGLIALLLDTLPAAALALERREARDAEQEAFQEVRNMVLRYAGAAGASDVLPVAGVVTVPTTQLAMLHALGRHYGAPWTRRTLGTFLTALGAGIAARFGASFGLRQVAKLIPVYGQSIGAAAAGGVSFATTYALGRAAGYFLYHAARGDGLDADELRKVYGAAMKRASHVEK